MASILENRAFAVLCLIFTVFQLSAGAIYKVGDSAGWTTIGNVDYKQWALTKTFQIGDIIVFEYNPQFHNVMQVTHAGYKSCNASSPISTHTTGNDSITIDTHGHHFFVCGVPGHCQAGQKVDINVLRAPSVANSPSVSPSPVSAAVAAAPAPSPSNGAHSSDLNMVFGVMIVVILQFMYMFGLF